MQHAELRLVCWQAANVWEDVHADSREFIRNYLAQVCRVLSRWILIKKVYSPQYPERPMVKLTPGQSVKTEREGQWRQTRVLQVDASLVRVSE